MTGPKWHLERHRLPYKIIESWRCPQYPDLKKGDAIIALGGPPSVVKLHDPDYEHEFLIYEAGFLGAAIVQEIPFFGICLSHQLRAKMEQNTVESRTLEFGMQAIHLNEEGRKHWLYKGLPNPVWVYQHHRDHVVDVNGSGTLLGSSEHCGVETVAWDDLGVSTQFHPEIVIEDIPGAVERYPQSLATTGLTYEQMLARIPADYTEYTCRLFDNFLIRAGYRI